METRPRSPSQYADTTSISLNRLLSRLEHVILAPDSESQLRKSSYERARISANVEYARTLLLSLEHSAASSTASKAKKSNLQSDLQQKRDLLKRLNQRLFELNELDDDASDGSVDSDEEDEDQFPSYAPRVKEEAGIEIKTGTAGNEALAAAAENLTSELRRRGKADQEAVTATGSSLFPQKPATGSDKETVLSHHRAEQETLTNSLLEMAKQLKQQSVHFGNTLEGDKGILDRAVEGLDKSTLGMEAAGQRMGALKRMTEGKGWWGRIKLYGLIFGLWIAAFLIVFVGPKIRF